MQGLRNLYYCIDTSNQILTFGEDLEEAKEIYGYVTEELQMAGGRQGYPSCGSVLPSLSLGDAEYLGDERLIVKALEVLLTIASYYGIGEEDKILFFGVLPTRICRRFARYGFYVRESTLN